MDKRKMRQTIEAFVTECSDGRLARIGCEWWVNIGREQGRIYYELVIDHPRPFGVNLRVSAESLEDMPMGFARLKDALEALIRMIAAKLATFAETS